LLSVRFPKAYNDSIFDPTHEEFDDFIPLSTASAISASNNTTNDLSNNDAIIIENNTSKVVDDCDDDLDKSSEGEDSIDDDGDDVIFLEDDDEMSDHGRYNPRASKSRTHALSDCINSDDFIPKTTRIEVRQLSATYRN
jgi:hypothetical protein